MEHTERWIIQIGTHIHILKPGWGLPQVANWPWKCGNTSIKKIFNPYKMSDIFLHNITNIE
jgi:hypothetical protein